MVCTVAGKAARSNALACLTPPFLHLFLGGVGQQVLELVDLLVLVANSVSRLVILASIAATALVEAAWGASHTHLSLGSVSSPGTS